MTSERELVLYACIAEGTTIVADFVRDDSDLETLAPRCLHHTPATHAVYTHTVDSRSYTFLIGERFVMFGIFDEVLEKAKRLWFLKKMRDGFDEILGRTEAALVENLGHKSLQGEMGEVFRRLMDAPFESFGYVDGLVRLVCDEGAKNVMPMQLRKGLTTKKKKKRGPTGELISESKAADHLNDDEMSKESLVFMNKHGNGGSGGRHRAVRSSWRKLAWIVLLIDLIVCLGLFGVWLYICRGFECLS